MYTRPVEPMRSVASSRGGSHGKSATQKGGRFQPQARGADGDRVSPHLLDGRHRSLALPCTVSRLLNGDPTLSVREETRRAIIRASEDLGYSAQAKRIVIPHEVALLDNEESDETLRDSYFADLRSALEHNAKQQRMELTVFHSLDEMLNQKGKFDGFMAIGANVIAESDLEKLHEVMPYGVFIDVNPAPNLFDSVQPDLQQTVHDAVEACAKAGMKRVGFIG